MSSINIIPHCRFACLKPLSSDTTLFKTVNPKLVEYQVIDASMSLTIMAEKYASGLGKGLICP